MIMQEINFYQSLSKPGRYAVNAKQAKMILTSWIIFLIFIAIFQGIYIGLRQTHLVYMKNKEKKLTAQIEMLVNQSPKVTKVRELENTIIAFSENINHKKDFIQEMERYHAEFVKFKPADYLKELADAATQQVWLSKINLQNQGQKIHLDGFTQSSSQLTQFVARVQNEPSYHHKPFSTVMITSTKQDEKIPFVLST